MKTIFAIALAFILFAGQASAQSDSTKLRSAFGSTLQLTPYRWNSSNELTEKNTRIVLEGGFQYIRFLGDNWFLQSGMEQSKRRNIRPVNGVESHVREEFLTIPVLVGYGTTKVTEGRFNRRLNLAGGGYASELMRQGIAEERSARIKMSKRENDYWKFGLAMEVSVMLVPKDPEKRVLHAFGIRSFMDIKNATIRNDKSTPAFSNYTGGSLFYSLYFKSAGKQ